MKKIKLLCLLAFCMSFLSLNGISQTVIAQQDFELTPVTPVWTVSAGAGNVTGATGTDTPSGQRFRSGIRSWQVNNNNAGVTLEFANQTIPAGYSSVKIRVRISSISTNSAGNGADAADRVLIYTALNGGIFSGTPDITLSGNTNSRWGFNDTVNASTPSGTPISIAGTPGTNAGTIYSTLEITIPNGTTSVALRITANNNDANEVWAIDDVVLDGVGPSAASGTIAGRVRDEKGNGLKFVTVMMTGGGLSEPVYATTNQFGNYQFEDIPVGENYVLQVFSRRYSFDEPSRIVNLLDSVKDIDFIGREGR